MSDEFEQSESALHEIKDWPNGIGDFGTPEDPEVETMLAERLEEILDGANTEDSSGA